MGGFEGGDEAGFWDIDTLPSWMDKQSETLSKTKSSAKPSISRSDSGYSIKAYTKEKELYDTISFVPCECEIFTIEGCDNIPLESNSIYKAFKALINFTHDLDIAEFFYKHKVVITKGIPLHSGLGGASSDAAAFILLVKEVCNLVLSSDELVKIGSMVAADVPFFICNPSVDT
jgi:4-diphosphocytidyl-2-C-methyl-D-erythritol kinase